MEWVWNDFFRIVALEQILDSTHQWWLKISLAAWMNCLWYVQRKLFRIDFSHTISQFTSVMRTFSFRSPKWWKWEKTISQANVVHLTHYTLPRGATYSIGSFATHYGAHKKKFEHIKYWFSVLCCAVLSWRMKNMQYFLFSTCFVCLSHGMWSFRNTHGS